MNILFFDTETTGLPVWSSPSDAPEQPHLVELAAVLVNTNTLETHQTLSVIVRPDGWTIPQETIDVHGITNEVAQQVGVPEKLAVQMLLALVAGADKRVCYNRTFDQRIIRIALKRYGFDEATQEEWARTDDFECAMLRAKAHLKLGKQCKLSEAFESIMGVPMAGAHRAMTDTRACLDIYLAMRGALEIGHG
ncbi:MAG TPA: 3'-5' exonuclease [Limnobacter sp.]|nr:3'-5' exonuclease [Limnobacter sp.]